LRRVPISTPSLSEERAVVTPTTFTSRHISLEMEIKERSG